MENNKNSQKMNSEDPMILTTPITQESQTILETQMIETLILETPTFLIKVAIKSTSEQVTLLQINPLVTRNNKLIILQDLQNKIYKGRLNLLICQIKVLATISVTIVRIGE